MTFDLYRRARELFEAWDSPATVDRAVQLAREYADARAEEIAQRLERWDMESDPRRPPEVARSTIQKPETREPGDIFTTTQTVINALEGFMHVLARHVGALRSDLDAARAEVEKYRTAAHVLCGAHIGQGRDECPVCEVERLRAEIHDRKACEAMLIACARKDERGGGFGVGRLTEDGATPTASEALSKRPDEPSPPAASPSDVFDDAAREWLNDTSGFGYDGLAEVLRARFGPAVEAAKDAYAHGAIEALEKLRAVFAGYRDHDSIKVSGILESFDAALRAAREGKENV